MRYLGEIGLQLAFIVLGALFLASFWIFSNVDSSLVQEFKNDRVSVILNPDYVDDFKSFVRDREDVIQYEIQDREANKNSLRKLYPELGSVLEQLEESFFPVSVSLQVKDAPAFLKGLESLPEVSAAQIVHRPPVKLKQFLSGSSALFLSLWILALVVVLYFQMERLAQLQMDRWSLMKMLGAPSMKLFLPICYPQLGRIILASGLAVFLSAIFAREFESVFLWQWEPLSWLVNSLFVVGSSLIGFAVCFVLFKLRYREVALG